VTYRNNTKKVLLWMRANNKHEIFPFGIHDDIREPRLFVMNNLRRRTPTRKARVLCSPISRSSKPRRDLCRIVRRSAGPWSPWESN
jgi:hypothetical protein